MGVAAEGVAGVATWAFAAWRTVRAGCVEVVKPTGAGTEFDTGGGGAPITPMKALCCDAGAAALAQFRSPNVATSNTIAMVARRSEFFIDLPEFEAGS